MLSPSVQLDAYDDSIWGSAIESVVASEASTTIESVASSAAMGGGGGSTSSLPYPACSPLQHQHQRHQRDDELLEQEQHEPEVWLDEEFVAAACSRRLTSQQARTLKLLNDALDVVSDALVAAK